MERQQNGMSVMEFLISGKRLLHVHKYIIKFLYVDREEMHLYFVPTLTKSAVDHILVLFGIF